MKARDHKELLSESSNKSNASSARKPKNKPGRRRARLRRSTENRLVMLSRVPNILKPSPYVQKNWVRYTFVTCMRLIEHITLGAKFTKRLWNVRIARAKIVEGQKDIDSFQAFAEVVIYVRPDLADYCRAIAEDDENPVNYLEVYLQIETDIALEPLGLSDWAEIFEWA